MITRCTGGIIEKLGSCDEVIKCVVCGAVVYDIHNKGITMECLFFPELKGNPHICSACVFEKLTGNKGEWVE